MTALFLREKINFPKSVIKPLDFSFNKSYHYKRFDPKRRFILESVSVDNKTYDYTNLMLSLALDVGENMLMFGGEVGRVENTIERICIAYGAEDVEVFSVMSLISAAVRMPDGSYSSQIRRIKSNTTDLSRLENFNALSREICATTPSLDVFARKIKDMKAVKPYPLWLLVSASAVSVGAFTIFFGGGAVDAAVAMIIGALISVIDNLPQKRLNAMAKTVFSSFIATTLALLAVKIGFGVNNSAIIIGSIMLLVPGLAFGTALRDLLCGDLLAGSLKTVQAILAALMIAFGYMLGTIVMGGAV